MRQILTVSLPPQMVKKIKREIKERDYATVSEFFRDLLREREARRATRRAATAKEVAAYIKAYKKYPESSAEAAALTKLIPQVLSREDW